MFEKFQIPSNLRPSDPRFGPGPSLVPMHVLKELFELGPHLMGTSHRKPAVKKLCQSIQEGLKNYFQVPSDYTVVLGNGGATFLFDAIGLGLVKNSSHHFVCGEFSEKWFKSHKLIPWIRPAISQVEFGLGICARDDVNADMICITLNETSTGVIADTLPKIRPEALSAVDATSGAGQVAWNVKDTDLFFFSPQKVFASDGGLYVAIMSAKARERALSLAADKTRYVPDIMNWKTAIENADGNQTYNTPAIATLFMLERQVALMNKLGYQKVIEMADKKAKHVYDWANQKAYLNAYVKEEKYRSNAVATIDVDDKIPVEQLLKKLEQEKVVYGIDAYRKLGRNQFRIALFHNITLEDTQKLTSLLSAAIESELK